MSVKSSYFLSPDIRSSRVCSKKWKAWNSVTTKPRRDIPFIIRRRYCPRILHAISLQNQINNLEKALGMTVNLDKTKLMIFKKGGHTGAGDFFFFFFFNGNEMEIVNSYKYIRYTLTTKLSSNSACEEYASKAKGKFFGPNENNVVSWKSKHNCLLSTF